MSGEASTTHTYNTCIFYLGYNLSRFESTLGHKFLATVNGLFPLIALYINKDGRLAVTASIDNRIYLGHFTRYRGEDCSRYETACIGNLGTHFHHIALGYTRYSGSTDML